MGGGATLAVLYAGSWAAGVPFVPVALVASLCSLLVTSLLAGTTDAGIETAALGAEAGFGSRDPSAFQPDALSVPGRELLVLYFVGLFVWGLLGVAVPY